jgi:hypothetical protein
MESYIVKPAPYSFICPIYGDTVKRGENCVEENDALFCMKILSERNLTPVAKSNMRFRPGTVRWDNLMMRLELETIAMDPDGDAAKKILDKYRRRMKARQERYTAQQN